MSKTQGLLDRIAALRREPEHPSSPSPPANQETAPSGDSRLTALQKQVATGARQDAATDWLVRQAGGTTQSAGPSPAPRQITASLRRLLDHGRALVEDLRKLADEPLLQQENSALALGYTETAAMADVALRLLQSFPESASEQLRLCVGLEGILRTLDERVTRLSTGLAQYYRERETVHTLAEMLGRLLDGGPIELESFAILAEAIVGEVRAGVPLRWIDPEGNGLAGWIAAHSLTTARVAARLAWRHPEFRHRAGEPVLAALVHDVGMLAVPAVVLGKNGPLEAEERREVELHTLRGADLIRDGIPGAPAWLIEAAASHHERLDGTGYPTGRRERDVSSLGQFLAVCDVYAALGCTRPHRPAHDPRHALVLALALAEQGLLDQGHAAGLLELSFYPTGTVVELADGSVGVVAATHSASSTTRSAARPIVALLLNGAEQPVAGQQFVDLEHTEGHAIVRTLPTNERRERLGRWFAEWAI